MDFTYYIPEHAERALLKIVNVCIEEYLSDALNDTWCVLEENHPVTHEPVPPGTFFVFIDTEREDLNISITLDKLVDRTIVCTDNQNHLDALAEEFERLAKLFRNA